MGGQKSIITASATWEEPMKTVFAAALVFCSSLAAFADPVEGTWQTAPQDDGRYGYVTIKPCGPAFCGVLTRAFEADGTERATPNIGRQVVWDMLAEGGGLYGSGKIWSPDRDKTYSGKMQLNGAKLSVSGCVLGICRDGGTWRRVE
jgi:uncharacterized protein (DUF2147 family)